MTARLDRALDETRNFVTRMTVDVYNVRSDQRCAPTFVTVAGGLLRQIHEMGGLRLKDDFGMGELTELIAHLNMFWLTAFFHDKMDVVELAGNMRGVGFAYHLNDEQIADWQNALRNSVGNPSPIGSLLAYFDRIVEPIAQIWGPDFFARSKNWAELLGDINRCYHSMMDNPEWIADLDAALDRA